jgi:RNA polymerase-binding transcription factor DksA
MADDSDRHDELNDRLEAIAANEKKKVREQMQGKVSAFSCEECGAAIPEERRLAIVTDHCIKCKIWLERK